jgi:hypothetical protein
VQNSSDDNISAMPETSSAELAQLKAALLFLHVSELKNICIQLSIHEKDTKGILITRILYFIETGKIVNEQKIPEISKAKRGQVYTLSSSTVMLKGAYKNDLKTRLFFKQLIGNHFHFTAFGIDWLNERWMSGAPPTYREFADMWQSEHTRRKMAGSQPKEEWAYINFTQKFISDFPHATRQDIVAAWEIERSKNVHFVNLLIRKHLGNNPY